MNGLMPDATSMSPVGVATIGVMIGKPNGAPVYVPPTKVNSVGSKCRNAWKPAAGNEPRLAIDRVTVNDSPLWMHSEPALLVSTSCGVHTPPSSTSPSQSLSNPSHTSAAPGCLLGLLSSQSSLLA